MTLQRRTYGSQIAFSLLAKVSYFLVLVMLYKSVSSSEAGRFTVIFALVTILATVAECGTRGLMIREMARMHLVPGECQNLFSSAITARWLSLPFYLAAGFIVSKLFIHEPSLVLSAVMLSAVWLDSVSLMARGSLRAYNFIFLDAVLSAIPRCVLLLLTAVLYVTHKLSIEALAGSWLGVSILDAVVTTICVTKKTQLKPWITGTATSALHIGRRALPFALLSIIGIVYLRTGVIIVGALHSRGLHEAAALGLAARLPEGLTFIPIAVMNTAITYLSRYHDSAPQKLRLVLNQVERLIGSAGILASVGIVAFPGLWIRILANTQYESYRLTFQLYGLVVVLSFVQYLLSNILLSMNQERTVAGRHAAILVANIALNLVIAPIWGALGCVLVLLTCEGAAVVVDLTILWRLGYRISAKNLLLFAGITVISMALAYYCQKLPDFYPLVWYIIGAGTLFLAVFTTSGRAKATT